MEKHIGRVKHYYSHLGVAVLQLDDGLQVGDAVHLRGHTTDLRQRVESLEINKQKVQSVGPGAEVALQLVERVREGDLVYKVLAEGGGGGIARSIAGAKNPEETQIWRRFRDRTEAGQQLAARLGSYANRPDVLVLALPRGGVPVAFEVAMALNAPLDVFLAGKLGVPHFEELAFGAIASGGTLVLNQDIVQEAGISKSEFEKVVALARKELERRECIFRGDRAAPQVQGRTVIVIDDGLATGATMCAAVRALRQESPARIIVAIPVAPLETCKQLEAEVDQLVCLMTPGDFHALGVWYEDFQQTTDAEVCELLAQAERKQKMSGLAPDPIVQNHA